MNFTDTITMVLKRKGAVRLLSIAPERSVYEALEIMAEHDIGALLVIADGRLVGVLSERDYARKGILAGLHSRDTKVSEMMSSPVHTVTPEQTVDACMSMMTQNRIRHLPVVKGDQVVGIISIGDLVKWVISGQAQAIEALEGYITGTYPG
ncbi:MAG TPA: CBS domain-containing protein [Terracidiphilus sp.]|nr:CBS domain-containing protein [Terracidiphilus sp.]